MAGSTGLEPATSGLARSCSTTELFPPASGTVAQLRNPNHLGMVPGLCFRTLWGRFGRCPGTLGRTVRKVVPRSGRLIVVAEQAAQAVAATNSGATDRPRSWCNQIVAETLVILLLVVVHDELFEHMQ